MLVQLFNEFSLYSKNNPILAGVISLWGVGLLTWTLRNIPKTLFNFIKRQCTTTLMFNNAQIANNMETFNSFMIWLEQSKWMKWSRTMSLNGHYQKTTRGFECVTAVGIGDGGHFFMYEGWPYWVKRDKLGQSGNSPQVIYEITITTIGRKRDRLSTLIEQFKYEKNSDMVDIFAYRSSSWERIKSVRNRHIDSVIIKSEIRQAIMKDIEWFLANQDWHDKRGISYKRTYVLQGPSGTGKTSLVKALASHYGWNICVLNLSAMSDEFLRNALAGVPKKSIVLIEDFDSCGAVLARSSMKPHSVKAVADDRPALEPADPSSGCSVAPIAPKLEFITLSGILNAFDGVVTLDEVLIFMTTNVISDIDPALLRPGRTDKIFEIPLLQNEEVREFISRGYDGWQPDESVVFPAIAGCELQQFYAEFPADPDGFVSKVLMQNNARTMTNHQTHLRRV